MDSKKTGVKSVKKRKRAWKPVTLDSPSFFAGDMEGFVSLEVLEDYDLDAFTQRDTGSSALGGHKAAESGAEEATVGNAEEVGVPEPLALSCIHVPPRFWNTRQALTTIV